MADRIELSLVDRLRVPSDNEDTTKRWDGLRAYLLEGGRGSLARDIFESILSAIDEEREEAAKRIEELEAALASQSPVPVILPPLKYGLSVGETRQEMRDNVRETALYQSGDLQLVWVNQGDLLLHATYGIEVTPNV